MNKKSYVNSCLNRLYKLLILFIGTIVFFIVLVGEMRSDILSIIWL